MKKKILSIILSACTVFMLLPVITFADTTPNISIEGNDVYCRNASYSFSFEIPEGIKSFSAGYEFKYIGVGKIPLEQNGNTYTAKVNTSEASEDEQSFKVYVFMETENDAFRVEKTIALKDHSGGIATCSTKAHCETCGNEYGEYDEDVCNS